MAIEAPYSKFKKTNLVIYIVVCLLAAFWFGYDGYFSKNFREKHSPDGIPDATLVFNRKSPPFFVGITLLLGVYLLVVRTKKVIAEENELILSSKEKISYDSIQKIDKTYFGSKGFFIITYKNENGNEVNRKLSKKRYDNLNSVLEETVAKIS